MPEQPAASGNAERFAFERIVVRRLSFQELEREQPPAGQTSPPSQLEINLEVQVAVGLAADQKRVEVRLQARIKPDPMWRPYLIEVQLGGVFAAVDQSDVAALQKFGQQAAPVILWPYVREAVYRVTMDGAYGPLLLDPVFLASMLQGGRWQESTPNQSPAPAQPASMPE